MSLLAEPIPGPMATVDLDTVRIDPKWALKVPASLAKRRRVLPLCRIDSQVIVACTETADDQTQRSLEKLLGQQCQWLLVELDALERALDRVYGQFSLNASETTSVAVKSPTREPDDVVAICDELFQAAILRSASDIHLIPDERTLAVHLRVDGILEPYRELGKALQPLVISRLKVLSGMDIAEKRSPQDGRISMFVGNGSRRLEIRVASLPTRYGERLTMRLLSNNASGLSLRSLGMTDSDYSKLTTITQRPHGLVLLTGPTGSGKSTTLFVTIQHLLETQGGNVITIEDPIEYEIQGASQVEVDSADKVSFSKALRSMLRHDPDVVMIGEIRDQETASTAIKAALTGHLVFSTAHTNTAAGVVTRLMDMGVEPFLIAATLRLSVAQRLVRKLCSFCRRPRPISQRESYLLQQPGLEGQVTYDPVGCVHCAGKGYFGRIGLFELFDCSTEIANLIAQGANETRIVDESRRLGVKTLLDDGILKVLDGTTTVAELAAAVTGG
jgi:type II secretory ATPase GspE/PulE/Tfp pilus assembly ATPase PilB-like protein